MHALKNTLSSTLILVAVSLLAAGCDVTSPSSDKIEETTAEAEDVVVAPSGRKLARSFYEKYGDIEKAIPVETPNGTIYRLITSKMDADDKRASEEFAKAYRRSPDKTVDSVDDCISSDREIQVGVRGQSTDRGIAPRGYVIAAVGVDIIGRAVADFIVEARQIEPDGDLGTMTPYSNSSDPNTEVRAVIPDDHAVVGIGLDNDGTNMDTVNLYYREINWDTFELTGARLLRSAGDGGFEDRQLLIESQASLALGQEDRAVLRGLGAGTGEDVVGNDFGSDDIEVIWGRYSLYDSQCLQDLRDSLGDDGGSGGDDGGSGGGSGGGGGGGFYEPIGL